MTTLQEIVGTTSPISMKKLLSGSSRAKASESLIYGLVSDLGQANWCPSPSSAWWISGRFIYCLCSLRWRRSAFSWR
jgi:hypothetical protein